MAAAKSPTVESMNAEARTRLVAALQGRGAHLTFEQAVRDFPESLFNTKPPHVPYTFWHQIEHIRIAQWDMLRYIADPAHVSPEWPHQYWPEKSATTDRAGWEHSIAQVLADRDELIALVKDPGVNLLEPVKHMENRSILRSALIVVDHTAYHLGELVMGRQILGRGNQSWSSSGGNELEYRMLGRTGWKVSAVSMGCWGIGGQWGEVSEKQALATIKAALDAGVNLFDTADAYGMGQSERLVGKAFKRRPDNVYIATKVGNWGRRMEIPAFKSIWSVMECCDASLYRMGMDVIDLYQCHIGTPEHPEVFVEAFERLREQGKIRHYAISTNDLAALKALNANRSCASCQMEYSILRREPEKALLPYCLENNIGVLLRGPLTKGILADKFSAATRFEDSVRQGWNQGPEHERFVRDVATVARLRPALRSGQSMVELALQFVLAHPAVTCPIPGMKNPEQARSNAAAADYKLSVEQKRLIDEVSPAA